MSWFFLFRDRNRRSREASRRCKEGEEGEGDEEGEEEVAMGTSMDSSPFSGFL
jgi:hypothetical protein